MLGTLEKREANFTGDGSPQLQGVGRNMYFKAFQYTSGGCGNLSIQVSTVRPPIFRPFRCHTRLSLVLWVDQNTWLAIVYITVVPLGTLEKWEAPPLQGVGWNMEMSLFQGLLLVGMVIGVFRQ